MSTQFWVNKHQNMKIIFIMLSLGWFLIGWQQTWAQSKAPQKIGFQKRNVLTPFQVQLQACLNPKVDVAKIDNNQSLYENISKFYKLLSSETLYREVSYIQGAESKKLKYEDGLIQIFKVLDDGSLKLHSSEKFSDALKNNESRHKILSKTLSVESYMNQLLLQADIKSDSQSLKEIRSSQLILKMIWSDKQIKSMEFSFIEQKKTLNCLKKELADICSCRSMSSTNTTSMTK